MKGLSSSLCVSLMMDVSNHGGTGNTHFRLRRPYTATCATDHDHSGTVLGPQSDDCDLTRFGLKIGRSTVAVRSQPRCDWGINIHQNVFADGVLQWEAYNAPQTALPRRPDLKTWLHLGPTLRAFPHWREIGNQNAGNGDYKTRISATRSPKTRQHCGHFRWQSATSCRRFGQHI